MIELTILGSLATGPMSGYEIKQLMNYTDYFYKVSNGSLYPTLRRMETEGLIRSNETVDNGRCKIIYELTENGHEFFMDCMGKPLRPLVLKDELLIRLFFADRFPQDILHQNIKQKLELVSDLKNQLEKISVGHSDEIDYFKRVTLQFGLEFADFMDRFYHKLLNELEENM